MKNCLPSYLERALKTSLLDREEEKSLFRRYKAGETNLRERILNANLRIVRHISGKYYLPYGLNQDDLFQEGVLALMEAIEKYDPEKGVAFSSYAFKRIYYAILKCLKRHRTILQVSAGARRLLHSLEKADEPLTEKALLVKGALCPIHLDAPLRDGEESLIATLPSEDPNPGGQVDRDRAADLLRRTIRKLPPKEAEVLTKIHGIGSEPCSQTELAKKMGVSQQRVGQLIQAGVDKLRRNKIVRSLVA